jgi:ABC-type polysaccharide/polyol phosphate transport system ATPase subunit
MSDGLLRLREVSKRFRRGVAHDTMVDLIASCARRLAGRRRPERDDEFWAVEDVSFEVTSGEAVGVIGPNGSGKSTALKLIAGILRPDRGCIETRGRITALIEINAGFHGDLTGRENIYMNGAILGMRKSEIDRKMADIIDFTGISRFIDTPVKRYSSGMQARLGFSVAAHVDPDILLVDEVLGVGDLLFRRRCIERMRQLVENGVALVFVTHHLEQMQAFCNRAVVLDSGRVVHDGDTRQAVGAYMEALKGGVELAEAARSDQMGRITALRILNFDGVEISSSAANEAIKVEVAFELPCAVPRLSIDLDIRKELGVQVATFNSIQHGITFDAAKGANVLTLSLPELPLAGGQYFWQVFLQDTDTSQVLAISGHQYSFVIEDDGRPTGLLSLPHEWSHETAPDLGGELPSGRASVALAGV